MPIILVPAGLAFVVAALYHGYLGQTRLIGPAISEQSSQGARRYDLAIQHSSLGILRCDHFSRTVDLR